MGAVTWFNRTIIVGVLLAVAGCDTARETFGFTKQSPDEFQVVRRAPLTLPPDYTLRVPEPGRERPQEGSTRDQAYEALTGTRARPNAAPTVDVTGGSAGETSFLQQAGAQFADPNIRDVVDRETTAFIAENESLVDGLLFWREPDTGAVLVDPNAESRRIQDNQALGRPVTDGDVPTIERRERGLLEDAF